MIDKLGDKTSPFYLSYSSRRSATSFTWPFHFYEYLLGKETELNGKKQRHGKAKGKKGKKKSKKERKEIERKTEKNSQKPRGEGGRSLFSNFSKTLTLQGAGIVSNGCS